MTLDLAALRGLVAGGAAAIRGRATLEPAGGPDDKVFPPTHSVDKRATQPGARYAFETRLIGGKEVRCVLLDSVQSQANRMELALEALWKAKELRLPVIEVDFSEVADIGVVTSLTAPHRVADALLRDSVDPEGVPFRLTPMGLSFADATPRNATPMFNVCPTGLVFGIWDSTGPRGGLGSKFARTLTSEIVGIHALPGLKTKSRIDPAGIVTKAGPLYQAAALEGGRPTWTDDVAAAEQDDAGAKLWKEKGKPSEANHSNIPPTIDALGGGVTLERAEHTVVLSLAGLRKLSFSGAPNGSTDDDYRTVLAALALVAVLAANEAGHDLRSRCLLVPRSPADALKLVIVKNDGSTDDLALNLKSAIDLLTAALEKLPDAPQWSEDPIATLTPAGKLLHIVTRSRELAGAGQDEEVEGED